jgi:hypothetical protein
MVIFLAIAVLIGILCAVLVIISYVRKERYFASEEFISQKDAAEDVVREHNEIAVYASEVLAIRNFRLGSSSTGRYSHLAEFRNTSIHNYRRDRNLAQYSSSNVHNCSLQVVRNASANPVKYLMKYFNIKASNEVLADIDDITNRIIRLEDALDNLKYREQNIVNYFTLPKFIQGSYSKEFMGRIGMDEYSIEISYPQYTFEYVSAGGNSSQRTTVTLDKSTLSALASAISLELMRKKSAAGQRALMTPALRESIKKRDNYTCRYCSISIIDEPNLLLEIDHVHPISKGGLSVPGNLQTLCWRCNRRKSNRVMW